MVSCKRNYKNTFLSGDRKTWPSLWLLTPVAPGIHGKARLCRSDSTATVATALARVDIAVEHLTKIIQNHVMWHDNNKS
jgi:hypothetical protein